jgi:hypothetical protein
MVNSQKTRGQRRRRTLGRRLTRRQKQRGAALFGLLNNDIKPRCQCPRNSEDDVCNKEVVPGTLFCEKHQDCQTPPPSGYELPYNPDEYNKDPNIRRTHNCLSYALGIMEPKAADACRKMQKKENCRHLFPQPGNRSRRKNMNKNSRLRCEVITELLLKDYPEIKSSSFYAKCPMNYYKIASVADRGNDHHWYRQNPDGSWSHKSGEQDVSEKDALGQKIFNPKQAARDYTIKPNSNLNYEDFCGFFCVPRDLKGPDVSKKIEEELSRRLASRKQEARK